MRPPLTPHPENFVYNVGAGRARSPTRAGSRLVRITRLSANVIGLDISVEGRAAAPGSTQRPAPGADAPKRVGLHWSKLGPELWYGSICLLARHPAGSFGVSGAAWNLRFPMRGDERFFGLGEKWGRLEKSGLQTTFSNTDVWACFEGDAIREAACDPLYGSIPYVIVERAGTYFGVLIDGSAEAFMQLPARASPGQAAGCLVLGAKHGAPRVYFLVGPSLRELTQALQKLLGVTPRPPLWALGHHQSRWGYRGTDDLLRLDAEFARHGFPADGLWLDIDYMRGFRVFTSDPRHLPTPEQTLSELAHKGRRVVAILDPGVKREAGYEVYDTGLEAGHFCVTPEGSPFVGVVWPGETVFPDFARPKTRAWWAEHVARFAALGFAGFWLDMNEPATGWVDPTGMLFQAGKLAHVAYHNRYALDMARATHQGLLKCRPNRRPFLVTRAHCQGISRYAAVWTGDNYSNERHLRGSIATTLNLALSGVPFNAPDVPGFGGDADEDLLVRWYKAGCLFPLLRNHSCIGTRAQEPWAFSPRALGLVRHFVRLRYKLLPYLYALFIEHERSGEAILRPLFYDFSGDEFLAVDDQFLVGPALMQAPLMSKHEASRSVLLPPGFWYEAHSGRWRRGGCRVEVRATGASTPLYAREGYLVPMLRGTPKDQRSRLDHIELHVFLRRASTRRAKLEYEIDDGESFDYRKGLTSRVALTLRARGTRLEVDVTELHAGFSSIRICLILYAGFRRVELSGALGLRSLVPRATSVRWVGARVKAWKTPSFEVCAPKPGARRGR